MTVRRTPTRRTRPISAAPGPAGRLRRRKPRAAPPLADPVAPFPVAGTLLLILSALMVAASWVLFERGQPGTPVFPDLRPDYGVDSTVTVYLPGEAPSSWSALSAVYRQRGVRANGEALVEQQLDLTNTHTPAPAGPLRAVVELRGAARVNDPTVAGRPATTVELGDRQLILVELGESSVGAGGVRGTMRIPPLTTENSRTSFASPEVGVQKACDDLGTVTGAGRLAALTYAQWAAVADSCPPTAYSRQTFIRLVTGSAPVRVDYLDTHPIEAGGSPMFRWKSEGTAASLRVRSSFVNIDEEAFGQRLFFLAGVAVGLATACAPYALQSLFVYTSGRARRR